MKNKIVKLSEDERINIKICLEDKIKTLSNGYDSSSYMEKCRIELIEQLKEIVAKISK